MSFRIEAYDIAHISGKHTVGAMVVMQNGEFDKRFYRKFKLKGGSAEKSDDLANLREILERRFNHAEWPLPNLLVVDGGQAQINIAKLVLENRQLKIPVLGVVKDERHKAREILGLKTTGHSVSSSLTREIIRLNAEAHRFAIAYHRQRRGRMI